MNWFLIVATLFVVTGEYLLVFQFPKWPSVTVTEPVTAVQGVKGEIHEPDWSHVIMACMVGLCGFIVSKWLFMAWPILITIVLVLTVVLIYRMLWCGIGRLRWTYLRWRYGCDKWESRIRKQLKKDGFSGTFEGRRL